MDYLVGIDLGSTNLKAVIYDAGGRAVARASRPTEQCHPDAAHPEWTVWRPEQIWGGVAELLREAVAGLDDRRAIRGVAVTGMGMDGLPVAADGSWLYPFISWHCPRTEPQRRWWLEHVGAERQFSVGGNQLWVFNTALRLLWMREHEPEILRRAEKWLLIEDFVNFMLCGRHATDYSMASTTLLFDQRRRTWSDELLAVSGIDRRLLGDVLPSGTVLGEVHAAAAAATGLPAGTPVVLGGHDYCCGALPTGAFRPGVVLDVLGTWEMVVTALAEPVLTPAVRQMGIIVDSHVACGMWTAMGATVAADMLEWFARTFGHTATDDPSRRLTAAGAAAGAARTTAGGIDWPGLTAEAAASPPGANGVLFLPHMSGSHCPIVDHRSLGAFAGLRNAVGRGDMLRAVIEGLDYQFLEIVRGFESGLGVRPERIVAIGGPTRNEVWMQNKADVMGRPVEVPQLDEAVPLGAALLAGIGVGLYRDEQDALEQVWKPGRTYEPDPRRAAEYAERFAVFEQLYPALRELNAQIHDGRLSQKEEDR
ncbi:MAG: FGGY family carbohydrate kinase [Thermoguttaceae bacterium]|jgi:xylulokinase